jgi:hypothetical protein
VDVGVFEELTTPDLFDEIGLLEEEIIFSIHLAGAWSTRGAAHGENGLAAIAHATGERGLAGAGGAGKHDQEAEALRGESHAVR